MKTTLSTRKPIDKITIADLEVFPIWEYATDEEGNPEQDETWIRPVKLKTIPANAYSLIVCASFSSASSRNFCGFMMVTTAEKPWEITPGAIVTTSGYHFIPSPPTASYVSPKNRAEFAASLGLAPVEAFPMTYKLHANITGEDRPREGMVA